MLYIPISRRALARLVAIILLSYAVVAAPAVFGAPRNTAQDLVAQTIRYSLPDAGEVFIVWGINDWKQVPQATWPAGTSVQNKALQTPMAGSSGVFTTTLHVPRGATIDYIFHITKSRSGATVSAWDSNGDQSFHVLATQAGMVDVQATATIADQTFASALDPNLQWYGLMGLLAIGVIVGYLLLRSALQNPYLNS